MAFKIKPCETCKEPFEPVAANQKFCNSCRGGRASAEPAIVVGPVDPMETPVTLDDETPAIQEAFYLDLIRLCSAAEEFRVHKISITIADTTLSITRP